MAGEVVASRTSPVEDSRKEKSRRTGQVEGKGLQIWQVGSENDGYFVGIVIAESEDEAREKAWWQYLTLERPHGEHLNYHVDSSELYVEPLGMMFFGGDGEGHLELSR